MTSAGATTPTSTWAPLRSPVYRALWIAQLVSNLGTWMQTVGAQWMLVGDPRADVLVPLVQTATTLPVMLLALPSGVLADLIDRRRLLIATQGAMAAGVGLLATLTGAGLTTPAVLLTLLFVIGCGQALVAPGLAVDPAGSRSRPTDPRRRCAGQHEHQPGEGHRACDRRGAGVAVRTDPGLRAQRGVLRRDRDRARVLETRPESSTTIRPSARWRHSAQVDDSSAAHRSSAESFCGRRYSSCPRAHCGGCFP